MFEQTDALYALPESPNEPVHPASVVNDLRIEELPIGKKTRVFVELVGDGLATGIRVPVLAVRGRRAGPVLGVTAALHGNELNGIHVIHQLVHAIDPAQLRGTLIGVVALNVPGLHRHQREFIDGADLNHLFPGKAEGSVSNVYAHRILTRLVHDFDYLVDLHTASFGRKNSLYVRADMTNPATALMAWLQRPQIIVHHPPSDYTLRGALMGRGVPSITLEIGDPQRFQGDFIRRTTVGVRGLMMRLGMLARRPVAGGKPPVICRSSGWIYTDRGGLLEVVPDICDRVKEGDLLATVRNAFGDVIRRYRAPHDAIVVGRSTNPVGQTGARIVHLGIVGEPPGYVDPEPLMARRGLPFGFPADATATMSLP